MSRKKSLLTCTRTIADLITLCFFPALLFGCSLGTGPLPVSEEHAETEILLKSSEDFEPSQTDVFIFNNDSLRRIDAYQRVTGLNFKAASRVGDKIMVAISNSPVEPDEWRRIGSYDSLLEEISYLEDEDPDNPLMSGQMTLTAGATAKCSLEMTRLLSRIHIGTICADFHTAEFAGEPLTDVQIYLTNVNASCAIMKEENFRPEMIVNQGFLDYAALKGFKYGEMLHRELPFDLTDSAADVDLTFCCYPSDTPEETYGSPYTRLVIEGKIRGITCYYPITVNREEDGVCFGVDGSGVGRNCLYNYDITLCRFGTDDPDTPVRKGDVIVNCTVEPWNEKERETIVY